MAVQERILNTKNYPNLKMLFIHGFLAGNTNSNLYLHFFYVQTGDGLQVIM